MWRTTKEPIISGIYCFKNLINNKRYIGQSIDIYNRYDQHIWRLDHKYWEKENHHLIRAWHKYGKENFEFTILEECNIDDLDNREIYWIAYYNSRKNGYNKTDGGKRTNTYCSYTEKEITLMHQGENCGHNKLTNKDIYIIIECFQNGEDDRTIAKKFDVHICTISKIRKHKNWTHLTEGLDLGNSKVKIKNNDKAKKPIDMYSINGKYISSFSGLVDAENKTGINHSHIGEVCRGFQKTAGGYVWRFKNHPFDEFSLDDNCISIDQYDLLGNYITTFHSLNEVSKKLNISTSGIRNVLQEKQKIANGFYWVKHGEKLEIKSNKQCRAVNQYDMDMNFIYSYRSVVQASKETNINPSAISHVLVGKNNTAGGYYWKYQDESVVYSSKKSTKAISIDQFDNNWNYINTYKSVVKAAKDIGISHTYLYDVLKDKTKTAGGYHWLRHGEEPPIKTA